MPPFSPTLAVSMPSLLPNQKKPSPPPLGLKLCTPSWKTTLFMKKHVIYIHVYLYYIESVIKPQV